MLFAWPVGAILGAGQWVQSHAGKKPSWHFQFDPSLQWMEQLVLWGSGLIIIRLYLHSRSLQARHQQPQNPRCRDIPSVDSLRDLASGLEPRPDQLLIEYRSTNERALQERSQTFFSGILIWIVCLQLGNWVTQMVPTRPFSPPRLLLLAICMGLPLARLRSGLPALRLSQELDERLLFDFSRQEISNINCNGDGQTPPARLLRFSEIEQVELRLHKSSKGTFVTASLFLTSPNDPPLQIAYCLQVRASDTQPIVQAAQKLADALGKPLQQSQT